MKEIAFFPLTPLRDSLCQLSQLEELHRLYHPCHITVFAIPLFAELYENYQFADCVIRLKGGIHGAFILENVPTTKFDLVFNHGYHQYWTAMVRQLDYKAAYGMEERDRSQTECNEIFTKWVSLDYWKNVTLKKYRYVAEQMAEVIRLVNPDYRGGMPRLSPENYRCTKPQTKLPDQYVLFLPGTSYIGKYWPIQKCFQLAKTLENLGFKPVFVIGPQDLSLKSDLIASGHLYFDQLSLSELAYVIVHSNLTVGNDSGPMHFAATFDVPTVHFYSFTGADNWFQYDQERHKLVMLPCGQDGAGCRGCNRTCIGKIPLKQALNAACELLHLPSVAMRQIGYFAQDLFGDALVNINLLDELSTFYAPCEITVFCTKNNVPLFESYAFCDHVFCYDPGEWQTEELPRFEFEAIFNNRYDMDSVNLIRSMRVKHVFGYQTYDIHETDCKKYYTKYLPLTLWDDEKLRRKTSVTEQGAALVRLVQPKYHCLHVKLAENTFIHDFSVLPDLKENTVLFVLGASNRYKHWGNDNYFKLAEILKSRGMNPLFLLGPQEADYAEIISAAGFAFVKNLNFQEVAQLMNAPGRTKCIIGNDTGMMHLACTLGCPSVTISAADAHFTWFPYDEKIHGLIYPSCSSTRCWQDCKDSSECVSKIDFQNVLKEVMLRF